MLIRLYPFTCPACYVTDNHMAMDLRLVVCPHRSSVTFQCDHCHEYVNVDVVTTQVMKLREGGVKSIVVEYETGDGPVIDEDELIRVGLALEALPNGVPAQRATAARSRTQGTGSALQP